MLHHRKQKTSSLSTPNVASESCSNFSTRIIFSVKQTNLSTPLNACVDLLKSITAFHRLRLIKKQANKETHAFRTRTDAYTRSKTVLLTLTTCAGGPKTVDGEFQFSLPPVHSFIYV